MSLQRALPLVEPSSRAVLVAALILAGLMRGHAQTPVPERTYPYLQAEVEKALQDLGAYHSGARLPVLDGFVASVPALPGRFERPYYQFQIQVVCLAAGRTLLRLSAKVTAWYADPDPSRSEYRTLPSNGRLEADLFDRLDDYLKQKGSDSLPVKPEPCSAPKTPLAGAISRPLPSLPPAVSLPENSTTGPSAARASRDPSATLPPASAESLNTEIARVRSQRGEAEKRVEELTAEVNQLEGSLRSQVSPSNLVAVKAARAAVREQPTDGARILFSADAEDEFEVLENRGDWAQVGFGTDPQGWVRVSQLDLGGNSRDARSAARAPEHDHGFSVAREEVNPFSGQWPELKGKLALFIWARSEGEASASQQLAFAKRTFLERYREASHSEQGYAGVVVIFLGPRGGVAAATLAQIQRWDEGALSDAEFLKRCSLDPPEAFRDPRSP